MRKRRGQSQYYSLLEAIINIMSGMVIAFSVTQFIAVPLLGISISVGQNIVLTAVLTIVSIIRAYFWRRAFNMLYTMGGSHAKK